MTGDLELRKEEVSCGARVGSLSLKNVTPWPIVCPSLCLLIATRRDILPYVPHFPIAVQGLWNRHSRVF